ncbi:transposase [Streptomyces collinus]|uniref:transposase n=1 Tax=Streptomyces collinus TaxID=42684 RepID=UPI003EBDC66B
MRHPQGGGLTAERQRLREGLRLKAAERFPQGEASSVIAKALRVNVRSIQRWRQKWDEGDPRALRSQGPPSLLIAAHQQLGGPIVLVWDNLNVHKAADLQTFAEARDWLTIYCLPPYAPDLNPVEGIWSLLRRGWLSNVAFSTPEHIVQRIRRGLRHIQYRSELIDGCLARPA